MPHAINRLVSLLFSSLHSLQSHVSTCSLCMMHHTAFRAHMTSVLSGPKPHNICTRNARNASHSRHCNVILCVFCVQVACSNPNAGRGLQANGQVLPFRGHMLQLGTKVAVMAISYGSRPRLTEEMGYVSYVENSSIFCGLECTDQFLVS